MKTSQIQLYTINSEFKSAQKMGFFTTCSFCKLNPAKIIIRWGNSNRDHKDFPFVINPSISIERNCDKLETLERISKLVVTPKIYSCKIPEGKRAVVRRYAHSSGTEFEVCSGPYILPEGFFGTEFLETDEEYRVWFCGNKTFVAKRVPLTEDDQKAFPCRSNWGYSYRFKGFTLLRQQTIKCAKELGLDCGAADVLKVNGKYVFLELNSAPSIDTKTLITFFSENLKELITKKFNINL